MQKKVIPALVAALATAGGALFWWKQRPQKKQVEGRRVVAAPASATSLSAQPHKRVRLAQPTPTVRREVPPPDSAEEGRTPYYFVPGEALVTLRSAQPLEESFLQEVAARFEGSYAPVGDETICYPLPEGEDLLTVVRLRWPEVDEFEGSLKRFEWMEGQVNEGVAWENCRVTTWMPNWLGSIASAERLYTPGGPAAYPRPVPAPTEGLKLVEQPFLKEWREKVDGPVTLAILDIFPDGPALESRSLPPALKGLAEALQQRGRPLSVDGERHYATFRTGEPFNMQDHGLMTAWLASEVIGAEAMERVTIEPIRVAASSGICSVADIIAGLAPLVQRARSGERIVALLAFVIGMMDIVPPRLRPYEEHYEGLRLACLALSEAGATLIGAAGNDATGLQHPPRTRLPAAFRSVIEVTAGQLSQPGLALYANQAKALCLFGGEANLQFEMAENIPALVGPAVSPEVRIAADTVAPNEQGWVAWAGTSFAAALAAGLAVLLRSQYPEAKMWEIRTRLRNVATDARNPGNVPFIDLVRPNGA